MYSLNQIVRSLFLIALIGSIVSCQTTYQQQTSGKLPPAPPMAKEGTKAINDSTISHKEVGILYQKLTDLSLSLQGRDKSAIEQMEIPAVRNSLSEAVLVLSQIRDLNDYLALQPQAKTENLYDSEIESEEGLNTSAQIDTNEQVIETPTLENAMLAIQVNLTEVLVDNMFLRNVTTYKLVKSILQRSSDSQEFRDSINDIISTEAANWASLAPTILQQDDLDTETREEKPTLAVEEDQEINFGPGDLEFADTVLTYSQKLADKGEYKKAISQIKRIPEKDPAFKKAFLSLIRLSNIAVLNLRQKAAQAFQSAMPIENATAQYSYLEQAKLFLEEALNDYPEAENRDTVVENLTIITKRLNQLEEKIEVEKESEESESVENDNNRKSL